MFTSLLQPECVSDSRLERLYAPETFQLLHDTHEGESFLLSADSSLSLISLQRSAAQRHENMEGTCEIVGRIPAGTSQNITK